MKIKKENWVLLLSSLALGGVWLLTTPAVWWRMRPLLRASGERVEELKFSPDGKQIQLFSLKHAGVNMPDTPLWQVFDLQDGKEIWRSGTGPKPENEAPIPPIKPVNPPKIGKNWVHNFWPTRISPSRRFVTAVWVRRRTGFDPMQPSGPNLIRGPGRVYDVKNRRLSPPLGGTAVHDVFMTPDEKQAVIWESGDGSPDSRKQWPGTLTWWDWRTAKRLKSMKLAPTYEMRSAPNANYVLRIERFNAQGQPEILAPATCEMEALDLRDGHRLWKYRSEGVFDASDIAFSRDATRIALTKCIYQPSMGWRAVVLNAATGQTMTRIDNTRYCAISPAGDRLATTSGSDYPKPGRVRLHDISHLKP